jgi:NAD(P)-dependent dehydrogenase (short-subunit alcohol dehydrogenase family)
MHGRLENKTIIVVGGANGIGAGTVERLYEEGANVVIGDVEKAAAEAVAHKLTGKGGVLVAACDISKEEDVQSLMEVSEKKFGAIAGIHVNAADTSVVLRDTDPVSIDMSVFDRTIAVNLRGHFLCTRFAVPALLRNGGGSIVYTSSRGALIGESVRVSYAISKAGIHALMRNAASRWGKEGIRANVVAPGYIETRATAQTFNAADRQTRLDAGCSPRLGVPADIAAMVAMLMSSDGEWINGQVMHINGGGSFLST